MCRVIALILIVATTSVASADPDDGPTERYGLTVAAVDLGALALLAATQREETGAAAIFGGPIVHYFYDNQRGSWWSLAARTTFPVAAGMAGVLVDGCTDDLGECDQDVILGGVLVGLGAAMVLDWTVLAKRPRDGGSPVVPLAAARPDGGFTVGLGGSF